MERLRPLEEDFYHNFLEKGACHAMQGHMGKHSVRRQKEKGKSVPQSLHAYCVLWKEDGKEAAGQAEEQA